MARRRASMREGPLAELFKATEAAQRQGDNPDADAPVPRVEEMPTVEYRLAELDDEQPAIEVEPGSGLGGSGSGANVVVEISSARSAPEAGEADPAAAESTTSAAADRATAVEEPPVARWADPAPRMKLSPRSDSSSYLAVIRVVGVGGGGLNAVNRMIEAGISQVEFVGLNTDIQQLRTCEAPIKLHIGRELTQGLGSGADAEIGRRAAEEAYDQIKHVLRGSDLVFVTAGEGGGTGSGAAPVVAKIARELGALAVGIVTVPFRFEGTRRRQQAEAGVDALRGVCDTVIVIPNDRLLEVLDRSTSIVDAFRVADDVLRQGVQGICDLITMPGLINLDFADVRTIMSDAGSALMGIGFATGGDRAREAAERALRSPPDRHRDHRRARDHPLDRRRRGSHAVRGERGRGGDPRGGHRRDEHHLRRHDRRAAERPALGDGDRHGDR